MDPAHPAHPADPPDLAALIAAREAEQRRLEELMAIGSAEGIAAARRRLDTAYAEADRLAEDNITQMLRLNRARIEDLDRVFEQMGRTWDAGTAVVHTLTQPPPPPQVTP